MHLLKEQMIVELKLRGYSPKTQKAYLTYMKNYTQHFGKSPDQIGEAEIKGISTFTYHPKTKATSYVNCSL